MNILQTKEFWEKVLEEYTNPSKNEGSYVLCTCSPTFKKEWTKNSILLKRHGRLFLDKNPNLNKLFSIGIAFLFSYTKDDGINKTDVIDVRIQFIQWMIKQTSNDTTTN